VLLTTKLKYIYHINDDDDDDDDIDDDDDDIHYS